MSKKTVKVTKQALEDLENILAYSHKKWGGKQARKYWQIIKDSFYQIDSGIYNRLKNAGINKIEYKEYTVEKHRIIVKESNKNYIIIRVLHQSMDIKRHL